MHIVTIRFLHLHRCCGTPTALIRAELEAEDALRTASAPSVIVTPYWTIYSKTS